MLSSASVAPEPVAFLLEYSFAERLYPQALETLAHSRALGWPVVLSDAAAVSAKTITPAPTG